MRVRRAVVVVAAVVALVAVSGCADDGDDGGSAVGGGDAATTSAPPTVDGSDEGQADTGDDGAGIEPSGTTVTISGFTFQPAVLEVSVGDTVTWSNEDGTEHTVTAEGGAFGESLGAGDRFEFTFEDAGTYAYFCGIHPDMSGEVVVS